MKLSRNFCKLPTERFWFNFLSSKLIIFLLFIRQFVLYDLFFRSFNLFIPYLYWKYTVVLHSRVFLYRKKFDEIFVDLMVSVGSLARSLWRRVYFHFVDLSTVVYVGQRRWWCFKSNALHANYVQIERSRRSQALSHTREVEVRNADNLISEINHCYQKFSIVENSNFEFCIPICSSNVSPDPLTRCISVFNFHVKVYSSMDTYPDFDIPANFKGQPQAFVAFIGLDAADNSAHKNVWDVFSTNRHPDRANIGFSQFRLDFSLPVLKPKVSILPVWICCTGTEFQLSLIFRECLTSGMCPKEYWKLTGFINILS